MMAATERAAGLRRCIVRDAYSHRWRWHGSARQRGLHFRRLGHFRVLAEIIGKRVMFGLPPSAPFQSTGSRRLHPAPNKPTTPANH